MTVYQLVKIVKAKVLPAGGKVRKRRCLEEFLIT